VAKRNRVVRVPLAALIIADCDAPDSGPGAPPLLLGRSVVECQARIARGAGAGHIVLLAARLPLRLIEGLDHLRKDGITIEMVRSPREAADHIHPDEDLLVLGPAVVPDAVLVDTLITGGERVLLTVPAGQDGSIDMRIDAQDHWSGLALLDGALLRDTAAMLGDWALAPTLLRKAVQAGVSRLPATDPDSLRPVDNEDLARARTRALLGSVGRQQERGLTGMIFAPAARWLSVQMLRSPALIRYGDGAPLITALAGLLVAGAGWVGSGVALALLAVLLASALRPFALLSLGPFRWHGWFERAFPVLVMALLLVAAVHSVLSGLGWGALPVAAWTATLMERKPASVSWAPDPLFIAFDLLIGSVAGYPLAGLVLALGHGLCWRLWTSRARP